MALHSSFKISNSGISLRASLSQIILLLVDGEAQPITSGLGVATWSQVDNLVEIGAHALWTLSSPGLFGLQIFSGHVSFPVFNY